MVICYSNSKKLIQTSSKMQKNIHTKGPLSDETELYISEALKESCIAGAQISKTKGK